MTLKFTYASTFPLNSILATLISLLRELKLKMLQVNSFLKIQFLSKSTPPEALSISIMMVVVQTARENLSVSYLAPPFLSYYTSNSSETSISYT